MKEKNSSQRCKHQPKHAKFDVTMISKTLALQGSCLTKGPGWEVAMEAPGTDGMIRAGSKDRTSEGIVRKTLS